MAPYRDTLVATLPVLSICVYHGGASVTYPALLDVRRHIEVEHRPKILGHGLRRHAPAQQPPLHMIIILRGLETRIE